jgi:dTDP-4-dehydrorhamnose reductase
MRIVVLGACGMLGRDVTRILSYWSDQKLVDVTALCHEECDVTSTLDILKVMEAVRPDVVINCAAYTDVDGAESDPHRAHQVNGYGPWNLVNALRDTEAYLIHLSSDYVLPGTKDPRLGGYTRAHNIFHHRPLNAYGRSKRDGELAVLGYERGFVVRSSWLYGEGRCFPRTLLRLAQGMDTINVVDDQWGCPTSTRELADRLVKFAMRVYTGDVFTGAYHFTSPDHCTWYDLARETFRLAGLAPERIRAVSSTEFPRPAVRPTNGILDPQGMTEVGLTAMPAWQTQLQRAFKVGTFAKLTDLPANLPTE